MKERSIAVRAGGTIPHPTRRFENSKVEIEIVADLEAGDDPAKCIEMLAEQVSTLSTALHERVQSERG